MDDFPAMHYLKQENIGHFYKCRDLIDYIECKNFNKK